VVKAMCWWPLKATGTKGKAAVPLRLGCVLGLAVICGAHGAAPGEQDPQKDANVEVLMAAGIKPDAEAIRAYLKRFSPNAADAKHVAKLIEDLGAEKLQVRQRATKALAALPVFPREALEKAARSDDLEVRFRAQRLLEDGGTQCKRTVVAALAVIASRQIKGLAAEVMAAGAHCPESERPRAVREALAATVTPANAEMLRGVLRSEAAWRRAAGAAALDHLLAGKADKDLAALLKDPDDRVRLTTARLLADRGRPVSLVTLAELLTSTDHSIRWESSQALRWLIGKTFDHDPSADPDEAKANAEKWLTWARGPGQKAKLRFPIKIPDLVRLFNGTNLLGWKAIDNGQEVDPKTNWQVKDGLLRCKGRGRGYLYHTQPRANYELTVEWRWPQGTGDSGVWFMMAKPGGARPACLEAQLLSGRAGDFWVIGNFALKAQGKRALGHVVKMADSSEKPAGQWNRMTIRVLKGTVDVKVNGVRQNTATDCPRAPGHIALQTEGDVLEFRNIQLRPLGR
jgi:hypothetical protein